jgi:hypothetical protein
VGDDKKIVAFLPFFAFFVRPTDICVEHHAALCIVFPHDGFESAMPAGEDWTFSVELNALRISPDNLNLLDEFWP